MRSPHQVCDIVKGSKFKAPRALVEFQGIWKRFHGVVGTKCCQGKLEWEPHFNTWAAISDFWKFWRKLRVERHSKGSFVNFPGCPGKDFPKEDWPAPTVAKKTSKTGNDIINFVVFWNFGRRDFQWGQNGHRLLPIFYRKSSDLADDIQQFSTYRVVRVWKVILSHILDRNSSIDGSFKEILSHSREILNWNRRHQIFA